MSTVFKTYKLFFTTLMLLFVCLLSNTTDNSVSVSNPEITLNTKVIISHISHTCSPANIESKDESERTEDTFFALKENKYYSLVKLFGEGVERNSYKVNEFAQCFSYVKTAQNIIIHKSLQQIGVLLI